METVLTFLDMDGYAGFIWPVYGAALIVCGGLWLRSTRALKQLEAAAKQDLASDSDAAAGEPHQ